MERKPGKEREPKPAEEPEEEEKAEGAFRERLIQSLQEFKEDIHKRHLSEDDLFQEANETDEMKRIRNRTAVTCRKVNRNHPYPYLL